MSLIKSKLIQNITEANPHLFIRDVERIVNTIFNEITSDVKLTKYTIQWAARDSMRILGMKKQFTK